jgi:5-methyltetrahydrofolate--homocysteine methyltransferase
MNLTQIYEFTVTGDPGKVEALTQQALAEDTAPGEIIDGYLIPAMAEVGDRYERNEFYVPELLAAAHAMGRAMAILEPLVAGGERKTAGRVVIGTVMGDLHDIGKNLVSMMLKGAGFEVVDLGVDVSPAGFVAATRQHQPQVVGLSALLSTTMQEMRRTIDALCEAGVRDGVKVMVGGAPVTQRFADEVGADGYAPDANAAVRAIKALLRGG